jgi:hypothetical protein
VRPRLFGAGTKVSVPLRIWKAALQRDPSLLRLGLQAGKALTGARLDDVHAFALFENPGVVARRIDLDPALGTAGSDVVPAHALGHARGDDRVGSAVLSQKKFWTRISVSECWLEPSISKAAR